MSMDRAIPMLSGALDRLIRRSDLLLAVALMGIVFMLVLPLPTVLVDILVAVNIGVSALLLMVAMYLPDSLAFASFPSVLLLTTLFRLGLSIATTRLILLQADAGHIIEAFGNFVVGGNLVVGLVVFLILTIVQFIVITKGAERVAEVAARFSLDGMPGKQMSIDADMRAGAIDMKEAKRRRARVEKESQLYGAMDGAMKFVKGDAIASIIIVFVNLGGGLLIGTLQRGMSAGEAVAVYSILTIGDGLIAQIPALLISITAGLIVTRVTTGDGEASNVGKDIAGQILARPLALVVAGGIMLGFALVPGMPGTVFLSLAAVAGGVGFVRLRRPEPQISIGHGTQAPAVTEAEARPAVEYRPTSPLVLDLSADAEAALDSRQMVEALHKVSKDLYTELGVPLPPVRVRYNEALASGTYQVQVHEIPAGHGELRRDQVGEWVDILTQHLRTTLKRHAREFIGIQEAHQLVSHMQGAYPDLVTELQRVLPTQRLADVLQRLVNEGVSIRNLRAIAEALVEWGGKERDPVILAEHVRTALKRQIAAQFAGRNGYIGAYLLSPECEDMIRNAVRQTSLGSFLALEADARSELIGRIKLTVGDISGLEHPPVLLTTMDTRRYVRKMIEDEIYDLAVLSYEEMSSDVAVEPLGRVEF